MAKAKQRIGRNIAKRSKVRASSTRQKGAKRAAAKKVRSKVRKTAHSARNVTAKKRPGPKSAARKAMRKPPTATVKLPVEDTIIDVVDEPAPGVIRVTEYEVIRAIAPERDADADMD